MNKCCGSKCPKCWTKKDSKDLYDSLLDTEAKRFLSGEISEEVYHWNTEMILKYDKP